MHAMTTDEKWLAIMLPLVAVYVFVLAAIVLK
jgi:hypothetical protein